MTKLHQISFLFLTAFIGACLFFSTSHPAVAANIPCPGVDGANGLNCGFTGGYNMGDAKCTEVGPDTSFLSGQPIRILGGQICAVGAGSDFPGYYAPGNGTSPITNFPNNMTTPPDWTYYPTPFTGGRTNIPSGEFSDDPNYNNRFYGGPAQLSIDPGWDDRVTINVGAVSYTTSGCTANVDAVYASGCPDQNFSGTPNPTVNPGDPVTMNVTNILRPNNGSGSWGAGGGSVYLNEVTRCYTATYINYLNSFGGTQYQNVTSYHPGDTPGTCVPDPCTIIDFHPDTNNPAIGSTDNLYFTLSGNYSYSIVERSGLDTTQSGINSSGTYTTNAINQNRTYTLSCGSQTQDVALLLPPPPVASLSAAASTVPSGGSTNISWNISGATSCSNKAGFSTLPVSGWTNPTGANASGQVGTGALASSQTYEITCSGPGGSADSNPVVVSVSGPPTATLTANGSHGITVNVGDTINYAWTSSNANTWSSNASAFPASCPAQGPWVANSNAGSTSGTVIASQSGCVYTITYTATNTATGQTAQDTVSININTANTITASPNPISSCTGSGSTTLNVTSNQAFDVRQDSTSGTIVWSGSAGNNLTHVVTTNNGQTFYLQKSGDTSSAGTLSTVTVTTSCGGGTGPSATISANPMVINSGDHSFISWNSTNATNCTVNPGAWTGTSGVNYDSGALFSDTTFTVTCSEAGFSDARASVTVAIQASGFGTLGCAVDSTTKAAGSIFNFSASGGPVGNNYAYTFNGATYQWNNDSPPYANQSAEYDTPGTYPNIILWRGSESVYCPTITATGGNGDLVVTDFHLTDASGNAKTTFAQNEQIYPSVTFKNIGSDNVNIGNNTTYLYTSFYSNAATAVPAGTASDVNVYGVMLNNSIIAPGQSVTYATAPTPVPGPQDWLGTTTWNEASNGTYTARVYVDSTRVAIENNHNNNQATSVYYIGSAPPCPAAAVGLISSTISKGGTTQASAPAGWSGGTFHSSNTSVATISGSTVTGVNGGTSDISGNSDWTAPGGVSGCGLSASTLTVAAPPTQPTGVQASAATTCFNEQISWNSVTGATSYNIYRYQGSSVPVGFNPITQATRVTNTASSPYTDNLTSSGSGTYYYWVTAVNSTGESSPGAANGGVGVSPQSCGGTLVGSDKDIVSINGAAVNPAPSVCDSKTEGLPTGSNLIKSKDIIGFQINLCNNFYVPLTGGQPATNLMVTDQLTNLQAPPGGWVIKYNGSTLSEDSSAEATCSSSSPFVPASGPAVNKFAVCGTSPSQTITINLSGQSIAQGSKGSITLSAQVAAVSANSSYGRFQNSASVTYNTGSTPPTATQNITTPLILYYSGLGVPTRTETP